MLIADVNREDHDILGEDINLYRNGFSIPCVTIAWKRTPHLLRPPRQPRLLISFALEFFVEKAVEVVDVPSLLLFPI